MLLVNHAGAERDAEVSWRGRATGASVEIGSSTLTPRQTDDRATYAVTVPAEDVLVLRIATSP